MTPSEQPARAGRPLGFDPDVAVDRVVEVFRRHGYAATTTALLEEATSLSRSSILNTFGPKERLFALALDRYRDMVEATLISPLREGGRGVDDVLAFFGELAHQSAAASGSCGCLMVNTTAEHVATSPEIVRRIQDFRSALRAGFRAALERATVAGEIGGAEEDHVDARIELLVGLTTAINWTARLEGAAAAHGLAAATQDLVESWRRR